MTKRVLIITYYWPPSGGSGVQRWLKMSKYLPENGWTPVIYTPLDPAFYQKDESLLKDVLPGMEVIKRPIWEPAELFYASFRWRGKKVPEQKDLLSQRNTSFFQRASTWVRGNVLIPDGRLFWVRPSVRYLQKYLKQYPADVVITTGPPHSLHLIGMELKRYFPELKWVADFRDPWSEWDVLDKLKTGIRARKKIREMEAAVLGASNLALTISPYHVKRLRELGAKKVALICNGFDEADFQHRFQPAPAVFVIRHLGYVDHLRNPKPFMLALEQWIKRHDPAPDEMRMEFYGSVDSAFEQYVSSHPLLNGVTTFHPAVSHEDVIEKMCSATVLLLVLSNTAIAAGNLPGKMFEYMASGRPILATGDPHGDASEILHQTGCGTVINSSSQEEIADAIDRLWTNWKNGETMETSQAPGFSRKEITAELSKLLDNL